MADSIRGPLDPGAIAEMFDDWADSGRAEGMQRGHALGARAAFEALEVSSASRYLDIGCGNGYSVRWAAAVSPDVRAVGVDISAQMIERARVQSVDFTNCEYVHGDFPAATTGALEAGAFDAVFSMEVLYYLPDLAGAIAAVRDLLAPHGRFACVVDHYGENAASHTWGPDMGLPLHLLDAGQWRGLFEAAGFDVEQRRVRAPSVPDTEDSWEQLEGSLMTLGRLP